MYNIFSIFTSKGPLHMKSFVLFILITLAASITPSVAFAQEPTNEATLRPLFEPLGADKLVHPDIVHLLPEGEDHKWIRRYMIDSISHGPRSLKTLVAGVPQTLIGDDKLTLVGCSANFVTLEYEQSDKVGSTKELLTMKRNELNVVVTESVFPQTKMNLIEMILLVTVREGMIFPDTTKFVDLHRCHASFIVGSEW